MKKSIAIGKRAEDFVKSIFEKCDIAVKQMEGKFPDYDLECKMKGKKKFTCEVKYDIMAQKTSNIAIEYHNSNSNKPSGIEGTKADIWAHVVLDGPHMTVWLINSEEFREWISNNKPKRIVEKAGDGNASLYLYSDDILEEIFTRVDNVDIKEIKKRVRKLI